MGQATDILANRRTRADVQVPSRLQAAALGAVYGATLCLFAASVVSVWAAYDGGVALSRFFLLFGGALAVLVAPVIGRSLTVRTTGAWIMVVTDFLIIGISMLYLASGLVADRNLPSLPLSLSDNQTAQFLAFSLPVAVASVWLGMTERRWAEGGVGTVALLSGVAALALTGSLGALLG